MKIMNKAIVGVLFVCGAQLSAVEGWINLRVIARELRNARITVRQGFQAIIRSGISLDELNRKVQEKQDAHGYADLK